LQSGVALQVNSLSATAVDNGFMLVPDEASALTVTDSISAAESAASEADVTLSTILLVLMLSALVALEERSARGTYTAMSGRLFFLLQTHPQ